MPTLQRHILRDSPGLELAATLATRTFPTTKQNRYFVPEVYIYIYIYLLTIIMATGLDLHSFGSSLYLESNKERYTMLATVCIKMVSGAQVK